MATQQSIAPVLEAVALAAAVRLRWPELDMDRSKIMPVNCLAVSVCIFANEPPDDLLDGEPGPPSKLLGFEDFTLNAFWTGSQRIWLGYGPKSDTLAVKLPERVREQLADAIH